MSETYVVGEPVTSSVLVGTWVIGYSDMLGDELRWVFQGDASAIVPIDTLARVPHQSAASERLNDD